MIKVIKRNGQKVDFDSKKIEDAIKGAYKEVSSVVDLESNVLSVTEKIIVDIKNDYEEIHTEDIQDMIENILMDRNKKVAKRFILYREEHRRLRDESSREYYLDSIENFINQSDWRTKENSNTSMGVGSLNKFITELVSKDYWLHRVYPEYIRNGLKDGDYHIHDMGGLTIYCCGYSLKSVINKGILGVKNIPTSAPAKHFGSILAQLANITTIFQNEIMGAVAFSDFDVLLAPFVKKDNLTYKEVFQSMQQFLFQINSNSRAGAEPAFSNITNDLIVPRDMVDKKAIMAGKELDFTYGDCQSEIDMINKAFCELMQTGDAIGAPFAYPIPTYNIHKEFDWNNDKNDSLWEMTGKYGYPYFANFINTDMKPEDSRSMCCRLRLDLSKIMKRGGGLFGSSENTGSIGVVTLNMPRYGYLAKTKEDLFNLILKNMELAKESLILKRYFLDKMLLEYNMMPAFKEYVGTLDNHFLTIGYVGLNELCVNFFKDVNKGISSEEGYELGYDVLAFMNKTIEKWQEEDERFMYNLESTPAESTSYRLALQDKKKFGDDIFTQGKNAPYYTNSCHLPVNEMTTIDNLYKNQHELQALHSGGTVIHNYLEGSISGDKAKEIIKYVTETYKAPYSDLCPVYSICPTHGHVSGYHKNCPECGEKIVSYQKITGYTRPVENFNNGKAEEFTDRHQMKGDIC